MATFNWRCGRCTSKLPQGFEDVDDRWELDPDILRLRARLETAFERQLRSETQAAVQSALAQSGEVADRLFAFIGEMDGPQLARFLQRQASRSQMLDFLVHRSIYHLKEFDPQSFVLSRLNGRAKVALAELQFDEYGAGRPTRLHSTLLPRLCEPAGWTRPTAPTSTLSRPPLWR